MAPKRSDQSIAIYGVLAIAVIGLVGYIVLLGLGREVPDALLAVVVASAISGVLGWARGGTYYDPTPEVVPAPVVADRPATVATAAEPAPVPTPAVYPLAAFAADPAAPDLRAVRTADSTARIPANPEDVLG